MTVHCAVCGHEWKPRTKGGNPYRCGRYECRSLLWRDGIRKRVRHPITRTKRIWQGMKQRCLNPNNPRYAQYAGAGVVIHEPWLVYENFLAYMGEAPDGKSIDRYPDPYGSYVPGNVRWATAKEQQNNMRSNILLTLDGTTQTLAQWAQKLGVNRDALRARRQMGWSTERILTEPIEPKVWKSHCRRGHEMTKDNVYIRRDNGKRNRKACRRIRSAGYKQGKLCTNQLP